MLILAATTDKFSLITSSTAALDVHVSYVDINSSTGAWVGGGKQNAAIVTATTTDILASPAATTLRNAKTINIRNKSAASANMVTVQFNQNATLFELHKVTLQAGEALEYIEGVGFFVLGARDVNTTLYVTANSVHATAATFAAITGLSWAVLSGRIYAFECGLFHINNATTTGAQYGIGGVAMTFMAGGAISTVTSSATAAAMSTGVVQAVDTAVIVQTTGSVANAPTWFAGSFQPSADGTVSIKATSEVTVAAGLTVLKGSWGWLREVAN